MERINSFDRIGEIKQNQIVLAGNVPKVSGSLDISFQGKNNILFIEDGVQLNNSVIRFGGDDALIYLSRGKNAVHVNLVAHANTAIYFGRGNYYNGLFNASTSERQNILVGNNGLFSWGIFLRTADPHLIYDAESKMRVNPSSSVLVGDHVWIGQNALVLKGSRIGSGAIIGGNSVVTGKTTPSNSVLAGNPGKVVKHGVFYTNDSVHNWTPEQTRAGEKLDKEDWVFAQDSHTLDWQKVDNKLIKASSAQSKLDLVIEEVVNNQGKNRFFISPEVNPKQATNGEQTIIVKEIRRGIALPRINPNVLEHPELKRIERKLKRIVKRVIRGDYV